jgi:hypothetical protein
MPYLTVSNLPLNSTKQQISNVNVYNIVGIVASCGNYNDIIMLKENGYAVAKIPLSYASGGGYFQDTGRFAVTLTVNVDIETRIVISRNDNISLDFTNGSASFNIFSTYGYFNAELANPADTAFPVIKEGSEFEIDGYRHKISSNLAVPANLPDSSGIIYLYAFRSTSTDVFYEFSLVAPAFNAAKNGYYNGYKRALWKMVYLHNEKQFLFKTCAADSFPQFGKAVLDNTAFNSLTASKTAHYSLSGADNPAGATVNLPPGVYVIKLNGAGGGGGYGWTDGSAVSGSSSGGTGGAIIEIMTLNAATPFTAFTGSGGYAPAGPASPSGPFTSTALKTKFAKSIKPFIGKMKIQAPCWILILTTLHQNPQKLYIRMKPYLFRSTSPCQEAEGGEEGQAPSSIPTKVISCAPEEGEEDREAPALRRAAREARAALSEQELAAAVQVSCSNYI